MLNLSRDISSLRYISSNYQEKLHKLEIRQIKDLFFHLPSNSLSIKQFPTNTYISSKDWVNLELKIVDFAAVKYKTTPKTPYKIYTSFEGGEVELVYFNYIPKYWVSSLKIGDKIYVSGKIDKLHYRHYQVVHPHMITTDKTKLPKNILTYPLTYGMTSIQISSYIQKAFVFFDDLEEWIDQDILEKHNWLSFKESLQLIHNSNDAHNVQKAMDRLAYDEFLAQQIAINIMRKKQECNTGRFIEFSGQLASKILKKTGFTLTKGQEEALEDIRKDQQSNKQMMRLVQGDVGSGKTLVALLAILNVVESGAQACLMAPTDVLANQHFEWISEMVGDGVHTTLLTGKITGKKRTQVLNDIASGEARIIVGTHALFQEKVIFYDLALIVIDEQHRFGVRQRQTLYEKSNNADILSMTATPIPRTLTLALYGDMELSRILDKPKGRLQIQTSVIKADKLDEIVRSLKESFKKGDQAYWVCPLIEKSEDSETNEEAAAISRFEIFKTIFGDRVGLVHGRLSAKQKEETIKAFVQRDIDLLVSTTVIEVGINVPNANIMIIEQAEKFGLSQLHQLRGRVGRGSKQSFCVLVYSGFVSKLSFQRLKTVRSTTDGFVIADEDLKLRGCGDIVGTKQSGLPQFKIANIFEQQKLLQRAHEKAKQLMSKGINLSNAENLKYNNLLEIFNYDSDNQF